MVEILAVDVGRTTVRAAIFADGVRARSVRLDSGSTLADPRGVQQIATGIAAAIEALRADAELGCSHVVIAAAGALSRRDQAEALADEVVASGIAGHEVIVTSDVVAAHAGAFDGLAGVLVAVGTGAVAAMFDGGGELTLVDGAGFLIGDAGSGYAVGRAGLAAAMRHLDGRPGGSASLARLAESQFGPLTDLPGRLHADSAGQARSVASFAPEVATAARDGDPVATAIWHSAVSDLADTTIAAARRLPAKSRRVAVTGSLFELADLVSAPLQAAVAAREPSISMAPAEGDSLLGACRLTESASGYERLLVRRRARLPDSPTRIGSLTATPTKQA